MEELEFVEARIMTELGRELSVGVTEFPAAELEKAKYPAALRLRRYVISLASVTRGAIRTS